MFTRSRFSQIVKLINKDLFSEIVRRHRGDRCCKSFSSWKHLVVMLYAQICETKSLRRMVTAFNAHSNHHYHLGIEPLRRSTLADANAKRSPAIFMELTTLLMKQAGRGFVDDLPEFLKLLDSTPVKLKGLGFDDWAKENATAHWQGLKIHIEYDLNDQAPSFAQITPANVNDVVVAQKMVFHQNVTYIFDKGYCDYNLWWKMNQSGALFVTRLKHNAAIEHIEGHSISEDDRDIILEDSLVRFTNKRPRGGKTNDYAEPVRRILVHRPDKEPMVIVTNDLLRKATEIAQLYKKRWQIELFFKWIKQNLKIKKFLGRSENAVKIQILTALITYLLTAIYRRITGMKASLAETIVLIQSTLFTRPGNIHDRKKRESNGLQLYFDLRQIIPGQ